MSHTQINKYKYTNTQIQHITKCQKDPTCAIFLKRRLFKDVFWVSHSCTRSSSLSVHKLIDKNHQSVHFDTRGSPVALFVPKIWPEIQKTWKPRNLKKSLKNLGFYTPADLRHWRAQRGIKFPFKCLNLPVSLQAFLFFWYGEMDQTPFHVSQIQFVLFTIEFCWIITIKSAFEQLYNINLRLSMKQTNTKISQCWNAWRICTQNFYFFCENYI